MFNRDEESLFSKPRVFPQWPFAVVHTLCAVANVTVGFWAWSRYSILNFSVAALVMVLGYRSYKSHKAHVKTMDYYWQRTQDRKIQALQRYYGVAKVIGEHDAYIRTAEIYNEASMRDLGIYKTPDEVAELPKQWTR